MTDRTDHRRTSLAALLLAASAGACFTGDGLGSGAAANHFCAVRAGKVRCWGANHCGLPGNGGSADHGDDLELPRLLADLPGGPR